jgi:hypothetical protein
MDRLEPLKKSAVHDLKSSEGRGAGSAVGGPSRCPDLLFTILHRSPISEVRLTGVLLLS